MKIIATDYLSNEVIKFLRESLDLTQDELSKAMKISKSSIEKYEYGVVNYPFDLIRQIAKEYNLEIIIKNKK